MSGGACSNLLVQVLARAKQAGAIARLSGSAAHHACMSCCLSKLSPSAHGRLNHHLLLLGQHAHIFLPLLITGLLHRTAASAQHAVHVQVYVGHLGQHPAAETAGSQQAADEQLLEDVIDTLLEAFDKAGT